MTLTTQQAGLKATTPAYQRYKLNTVTMVAHDVVFSTEECNIDDAHALAFKPSIPPNYRLCEHCAANIARHEQLGDLVDEPQTRIWLITKPRISEVDARLELAAKTPVPAPAAGLVGAESSRDPTRGDGGGITPRQQEVLDEAAQLIGANAGQAPSSPAPSPPAASPVERAIVPFPLGGHSIAFLSPDSSNIERVTWLDGNAHETELSWQYRDGVPRLLVEFKGGTRYIYDDVGFEIWEALRAAESVGQAFDALVKKQGYAYRQLDVDELRGVIITAGSSQIFTGAAADEAQAELTQTAANEDKEPSEGAPKPPAASGRGRRNPTKGESELTAQQLAERDAAERERLARLEDDTMPEV